MELKILSAIEHIRRNKEMYLGRSEMIPDLLVCSIINDAIVLGTKLVLTKRQGDWWLIGSDIDWLLVGHNHDVNYLFNNLVPLEGGGQNALRRESLLMAFAESIVTFLKLEEQMILIKGDYPPSSLNDFFKPMNDIKIIRYLLFNLSPMMT